MFVYLLTTDSHIKLGEKYGNTSKAISKPKSQYLTWLLTFETIIILPAEMLNNNYSSSTQIRTLSKIRYKKEARKCKTSGLFDWRNLFN